MLRAIFAALLVAFTLNCYAGGTLDIYHIYVESRDNRQGAKLYAQEEGLRKAFFLLADKFAVSHSSLMQISTSQLKAILASHSVQSETARGGAYQATIDYHFNKSRFTELIYNNSPSIIQSKIYQCMVIPIFKIGSRMIVKDYSIPWLEIWQELKKDLSKNAIAVVDPNSFESYQIDPYRLAQLSFGELAAFGKGMLVRTYVLVTCEYLTNRIDGASNMQLSFTFISDRDRKHKTKSYMLKSQQEIPSLVKKAIRQFASEYGYSLNRKSVSLKALAANQKNLLKQGTEIKVVIGELDPSKRESVIKIIKNIPEAIEVKKLQIPGNIAELRLKLKTNIENFTSSLLRSNLSYKIENSYYYIMETPRKGL